MQSTQLTCTGSCTSERRKCNVVNPPIVKFCPRKNLSNEKRLKQQHETRSMNIGIDWPANNGNETSERVEREREEDREGERECGKNTCAFCRYCGSTKMTNLLSNKLNIKFVVSCFMLVYAYVRWPRCLGSMYLSERACVYKWIAVGNMHAYYCVLSIQ